MSRLPKNAFCYTELVSRSLTRLFYEMLKQVQPDHFNKSGRFQHPVDFFRWQSCPAVRAGILRGLFCICLDRGFL